jgi:hypothetical protein
MFHGHDADLVWVWQLLQVGSQQVGAVSRDQSQGVPSFRVIDHGLQPPPGTGELVQAEDGGRLGMVQQFHQARPVGFSEGAAYQAGADTFLLGNLGHWLESSPPGHVLAQAQGASPPETEDGVRFAEDLVAMKAAEAAFAQDQDCGSIPDAAVFLALGSGGMDPGGPPATDWTGCGLCLVLDGHFQTIPG